MLVRRLALWLLRVFRGSVPKMPHVYALHFEGERVADLTTNLLRARALAKESACCGNPCQIVRLVAVDVVE